MLSRIAHLSLEHGRAQIVSTVAVVAGVVVMLAASRSARAPILRAAAVAVPVTAVIGGAVWARSVSYTHLTLPTN